MSEVLVPGSRQIGDYDRLGEAFLRLTTLAERLLVLVIALLVLMQRG